MNWDAIGAIAEQLGAIGVIASLVYLATQIRESREQTSQNTRAVRASTFQQFRQEILQAWSSAVTTPDLARAVRSGIDDFDGLDDDDTFYFEFWVTNLVHGYDNVYYQYRAGMLNDERWAVQRASLVDLFSAAGVVQAHRCSRCDTPREM